MFRPLTRPPAPAPAGAFALALALVLPLAEAAYAQTKAQPKARTAAPAVAPIDIPFQKFTLPNGLRLIVHEDHKAPIVAVNVWYHVGSKDERPGRTGFAHLFEHLMFNGSEHYDHDYLGALERVGATDLNGTTNPDRTNYFQNVPVNALDRVLWLESDRMGHLLGAVTQAKLDEQRGVVQNEKRQGENAPYGKVPDFVAPKIYPANHPYSWSTIGSMEDLDAAKLEDVREWFRTYYGAANAVIVIAGDVDADSARAKVGRYFGDVPAGPPIARPAAWVAKRAGSTRATMYDRVPQARVYRAWNVAEWAAADADLLRLAGDVLSSGKSSRLYKRLVYDDRIATEVSAAISPRELGSLFLVTATVRPGVDPAVGDYRTTPSTVDRTKLPDPGPAVDAKFPPLARDTLSNGLGLVVVERRSIPQVRFDLLLDAGYAADASAAPGTASLAMAMLDEGTSTRNALAISDELSRLGANLTAGASMDVSTVSLEALEENLDASLALYADVVLRPSFPRADLERLKQQRVAAIRREQADPVGMGMRVLPALLYGPGHAYANPWSGTGTEESVAKIGRDDLVRHHRTWFKPNHATLVVTGATSVAAIKPKLERLFASWRPGDVPAKEIGTVRRPERSVVYLMDRPGALQSVILVGTVTAPKAHAAEPAFQTMNGVLGREFSSRLNMNLREDKHWSYGVRSFFSDARGQRPFIVRAPVQTDKTKESVAEIAKELREIRADRAPTAEEVARAQASLTLALPGSWETMGRLAGAVSEIVTFGLPDRYWDTYADAIRAQTPAGAAAAAAEVVDPSRLVWVVIGDRAKIEAGLRELELGEVRVIDANGKPVN